MNLRRFILSLIILLAPVLAGADEMGEIHISPKPRSIEMQKGRFKAVGKPMNCDSSFGADCLTAIREFANSLSVAGGKVSSFATSVGLASAVENGKVKGFIFILDPELDREEYSIDIGPKSVVVNVSGFSGLSYAIETLKQMLPDAIYGNSYSADSDWYMPCAIIKDKPEREERGLMLDCSRHFFSVAEIKRVLGRMAEYKMNLFRWHLTDDQGWRVEIKKYPELTLIGGYRDGTITDDGTSDGRRYGGYYTQEQIKDIVGYAAGQGITVIPEITVPGHVQAALAALPWLGCAEEELYVAEGWDVSSHGLCPAKNSTYDFLDDLFGELAYLFPAGQIILGGYDCPLSEWAQCPDCQDMAKTLGLSDTPDATAMEGIAVQFRDAVEALLENRGKKAVWLDGNPEKTGDESLVWTEKIVSDQALDDYLFPLIPAIGEKQWNGK